jgi:hypothetical protein
MEHIENNIERTWNLDSQICNINATVVLLLPVPPYSDESVASVSVPAGHATAAASLGAYMPWNAAIVTATYTASTVVLLLPVPPYSDDSVASVSVPACHATQQLYSVPTCLGTQQLSQLAAVKSSLVTRQQLCSKQCRPAFGGNEYAANHNGKHLVLTAAKQQHARKHMISRTKMYSKQPQ